jgi:hypothetical protein
MLGVATMRATGARVGGTVRVTVADPGGKPHVASFGESASSWGRRPGCSGPNEPLVAPVRTVVGEGDAGEGAPAWMRENEISFSPESWR